MCHLGWVCESCTARAFGWFQLAHAGTWTRHLGEIPSHGVRDPCAYARRGRERRSHLRGRTLTLLTPLDPVPSATAQFHSRRPPASGGSLLRERRCNNSADRAAQSSRTSERIACR